MYELIPIQSMQRWRQILHLFPASDIFYTPEYFSSALKLDPGEAFLFYFNGKHGEVAYPFIKRELGGEGHAGFFDITTPFGYGGPLLNIKHNVTELTDNFRAAFIEYCRNESIIVEYVRFHPLKQNAALFHRHMNLYPIYDTYTLCMADMEPRGKNDSGIVVKKLGTVRHLFDFLILYYSTIRRRESTDSYYFFTNDYFETLVSLFGPDLHLFGAYENERLLAACYVLASGNTLFMHVEGTLGKEEEEKSVQQLLLTVAEWGQENLYEYFHIGGDYLNGEPNEKAFKKEICPDGTKKFFIGRQIYDQSLFEELSAESESEMIRKYRNK